MKPEEQVPAQIQAAAAPKDIIREQDKIMLVLAYLGLFAFVPFFTVKDSDYVQWHAKNGLVLGLGGAAALILLALIPIVQFLDCLAIPALLVVDLLAMVKAIGGQRWRIPFVTDLAEKL